MKVAARSELTPNLEHTLTPNLDRTLTPTGLEGGDGQTEATASEFGDTVVKNKTKNRPNATPHKITNSSFVLIPPPSKPLSSYAHLSDLQPSLSSSSAADPTTVSTRSSARLKTKALADNRENTSVNRPVR